MANLVFDFLHNYETGERRESEPANAYQYDEGHVIEATLPTTVTSCEVHYWIRGQEKSAAYTPGSITVNDDGSCTVTCNVPNTYFETNGELRVYIVVTDGDASITTYEGYVHICQRSMPDDYVDDDPENEATRILTEARAAAATATAAAETAQDVADSIPADYSVMSADVDTLKTDVTDLKEDISDLENEVAGLSGVPTNVRQAILSLFESAAYAETGLTDEITVIEAWAETVTSLTLDKNTVSISGTTTSQITATTVPAGKTVTWSSSNESVATVSSTGLVTGVGNGTAIITATSGDINVKCTVTVSGIAELVSISAVYTQSGTVYDTDTLDSLKSDLVVTGTYDDSSTATITNYVLSGTLAKGTQTITVTYGGKTDTFTVNVTHYDTSIYNWDFTQSLIDSKQNVEAVLTNATQDANGVTITVNGGKVVLTNINTGILGQFTIEVDVTRFNIGDNGNGGLLLVTKTNFGALAGVLYRNGTHAWCLRNHIDEQYHDFTDLSDKTMFNGKTLKLQVDNDISTTWKLYCDGELVATQAMSKLSGDIGIALGLAPETCTAVRIYEGLV